VHQNAPLGRNRRAAQGAELWHTFFKVSAYQCQVIIHSVTSSYIVSQSGLHVPFVLTRDQACFGAKRTSTNPLRFGFCTIFSAFTPFFHVPEVFLSRLSGLPQASGLTSGLPVRRSLPHVFGLAYIYYIKSL
jgi:hypothetical protein